ncbi:MAG TPA: hypothetical protein VD866_26415 [Urbifossiella sp.]|nr:hypothetical protein [Urbifossiella sp.]
MFRAVLPGLITAVLVSSLAADEIAGVPVPEDFRYPGAKDGLANAGLPKKAPAKAWTAALVTDDDAEKVARWYWDRLGLGNPVEKNSTTGLFSGTKHHEQSGLRQTATMLDWNFPRAKGEGPTRVFQALVTEAGGKRGDFALSLTLHRRPDPPRTEILLSYAPTK